MLAGCSKSDGRNEMGNEEITGPANEPVAEPEAPVIADLASAEAAWNAADLDDYQFTLTRICFCDPEPPVVIIVRDDAVESAFYQPNGEYLSAEELAELPTVDGLFQEIKDAYAAEVALVEASYNNARGYPESVFIDYDDNFVDEESGFEVSGFQ
ncbi:hypothetical protein GCM10022278_12470 [Allohahella marinimesophila]|uniref:Beta-lactamase inhibitor (BLIP) n=2 Tax=Allohahella marinimesophila TaxID=1054972 RepID=A0ABP7NW84_9GAMM